MTKIQKIEKPQAGEYAAFAVKYIGLLPDDGLVLKHLKDNLKATTEFILSLPEERLSHRYAENKWTIKEILAHVVDGERIYAFRTLLFARKIEIELPGFERDDYVLESFANQRCVEDILSEFASVRSATVSLFENLDPQVLTRTGSAGGNRMSVRAMAYHIAGHELHHLNVIKTRYL